MRRGRQMCGRRGRWDCEIIKETCLGRKFWMEACVFGRCVLFGRCGY